MAKKKHPAGKGKPVGQDVTGETLDQVRGGASRPQPDDQVLVQFEHGDTRAPVVIGRLWNGKDRPPE